MSESKIVGLDGFQKKMDGAIRNLKEIDGSNRVALTELIPSQFIQRNTSFTSVEELFEASGFDLDNFEVIPKAQLDAFVSSVSKFSGWDEMLRVASEECLKRRVSAAL